MSEKTANISFVMRRAFSLIELLVVVAMVALLLGLLAPVVSGWGETVRRRSAVVLVMGACEQARAAAIESGQRVFVGFADATHPDPALRHAAFLVFRAATEDEQEDAPGREFVVLKNWSRLPVPVVFWPQGEQGAIQPVVAVPGINRELTDAGRLSVEQLPALSFTASGGLTSAASPIVLGVENRPSPGGGDRISLARFTGRAQYDATDN